MLRPRYLLQPAERYPADPRAVFILVLSVFSGLVGLAAEKAPGTLESAVPTWGILLWNLGLGLGALLAVLGLLRDSVNGIIVEQIGSVMVGVATIFYAVVALAVVGASAGQPMTIIIGWGIACLIRYWQLQLLLRRMQHAKIKIEATQIASDMIDQHRSTGEGPGQ